jgi:hypothetical protein
MGRPSQPCVLNHHFFSHQLGMNKLGVHLMVHYTESNPAAQFPEHACKQEALLFHAGGNGARIGGTSPSINQTGIRPWTFKDANLAKLM